jgi:DNA processing protein
VATKRITAFFSEQAYAVVSGLALGCDAVAHEECVRLRAPTIAVLAHGLQTIVPKRNAGLAEAILDVGGLWISEFPIGVEPQPQFFVQRDKTQALLSTAIVMMQSDLSGGSLHASRAALKNGRWLIVPHPTSADVANQEPKIQANLLLSEGDDQSKADLLKCSVSDLSRLLIVRGRDDYDAMIALISRKDVSIQQALLI